MPDFQGLAIVAAVAFCAPLLLGFLPGLRLPSVVLELVAGIVIGPSVLGWVQVDDSIALFALVGLAFLLLIAGLEIDFTRLRGPALRLAVGAFLLTIVLALAAGGLLDLGGFVSSPLLVAIALSATSLGIVITILKDAGETESRLGQTLIASCSLAEVLPIVLLSLFFSMESSGTGTRVILLAAFGVLGALVGLAIIGFERWRRLSATLLRLQDTTAQIRVRGAFLLLAVFVVLAGQFGLEAILGAFIAGAVIKLVDTDGAMTHPRFREKLEAAGFGVFIPFFFVTSGIRFDLDALLGSASALAQVPLFLAALLLVRGLPALLYRGFDARRTTAAALLQATSLSFIVVAADLGRELGVLSGETAAALIAAGLVSVLAFPLVALTVLRGARADADERLAKPALAARGS